MKDTIIAVLIGIIIGIFLMAYPIVRSGGGMIHSLDELEKRMEKEEQNKWYRR